MRTARIRLLAGVVAGSSALAFTLGAGPVTARGTIGRAAGSSRCCPATSANPPCATIVETTSERTPSARLRSLLATLRRPWTPADVLPPANPESAGVRFGEGIYLRFVRRAAVIHGETLFLVPVARACEAGHVVREALVLFAIWPGPYGSASSYSGPSTAGFIEQQGIEGYGVRAIGNVATANVVAVVPDGVAKVTLIFPRRVSPASVAVTVPVVNNVYAAFVAENTPEPEPPEKIVWRSRRGKILKTLPE